MGGCEGDTRLRQGDENVAPYSSLSRRSSCTLLQPPARFPLSLLPFSCRVLEENPEKRILEKGHESEEKFCRRSVAPSAESFLAVVKIPHSLRTPMSRETWMVW